MKHRELTDHIEGSFLKRQYLEAFLVQGAYIESLLKMYADFSLFKSVGKDLFFQDKIIVATRNRLEKINLYDLITFLHKADLISKEQRDLLNEYRESRNKTLHYIINEIKKDGFEESLKEICSKGNKIIKSDEFIKIADLIDFMETPIKALEDKK